MLTYNYYHLIDELAEYDDALEYIRKEYNRFKHLNINNDMISEFYIGKVLTHPEKLQIKDLKVQDRMEHLLDYIIIPSLGAKTSEKFVAFINILNKSDDATMNRVATDIIRKLFQ